MRALRRAKSIGRRVGHWYRHYRALRLFRRSLEDGKPVNPRPECPLIVIGMHRSGTSLLARQFEDLGVFMGKWQGKNTNEAMFFRHRNQLLLSLAHASWDNPDAFLRALENSDWRRAFARVAAGDLGSIRTFNFLPPKELARFTPSQHQFWGFKDPRSSLTLPVWCDIFPNAKIINIVRDGNAVASSLFERSMKQLRDGSGMSLVSLDPAMGIKLWAEYVLTAHSYCASLPQDRYLEIRYENLVQKPEAVLLNIADFIGLNADSDQLQKAASRVNRPQRSVEPSGPVCENAQKALELYGYL
ncbi:MAG: sulfotransferase [Woeseiaceae bacterium]